MMNNWKRYALSVFLILAYTNYYFFKKYMVVKNSPAEYNRRLLENHYSVPQETSYGKYGGSVIRASLGKGFYHVVMGAREHTTELYSRKSSTERLSRLVIETACLREIVHCRV